MSNISKITKKKNPKGCIKLGLTIIPLIFYNNKRIKLILHEGTTKVIKRRTKIKAGEIMFEFPDCVVCHANSFFIGKPIPILSIHDHLVAGQTYFIIPLDRLPPPPQGGGRGGGGGGAVVSAAWLFSPGSSPSRGSPSNATKRSPKTVKLLSGDNYGNYGNSYNCSQSNSNNSGSNLSPFEYVKDKDGRVAMIKVVPEFITRVITSNCNANCSSNNNKDNSNSSPKLLCSTPELQKQYEQLVRDKGRTWSPKLDTITEHKIRFSPSRFLRYEWKQKKNHAQNFCRI